MGPGSGERVDLLGGEAAFGADDPNATAFSSWSAQPRNASKVPDVSLNPKIASAPLSRCAPIVRVTCASTPPTLTRC